MQLTRMCVPRTDLRIKRLAMDVRNNAGGHVAIALNHSEDDRLARSAATALAPSA